MLTINKYSRPNKPLKRVRGLVLHWPDYPRASARSVYNIFESRKNGNDGYGATHKIIGLEGEIVECIPEKEMAYHCGSKNYTNYAMHKFGTYPNNCTLSVELCHIDEKGTMNKETFEAAVNLMTIWCKKYGLKALDITTHHNIVGWKECPKWFVDNPYDLEYLRFLVDLNLGGV